MRSDSPHHRAHVDLRRVVENRRHAPREAVVMRPRLHSQAVAERFGIVHRVIVEELWRGDGGHRWMSQFARLSAKETTRRLRAGYFEGGKRQAHHRHGAICKSDLDRIGV